MKKLKQQGSRMIFVSPLIFLLLTAVSCEFQLLASSRCLAKSGKEYQFKRPVDCGDDALLVQHKEGFSTLGLADVLIRRDCGWSQFLVFGRRRSWHVQLGPHQ